jgi:ubiquinone/menaquinone biosynthesis C-methylase UbiE
VKTTQTHTFPAHKAHQLDHKFRRWLQNPFKILAPFVHEGMTVIDYGCGNGFFSMPLSSLTGGSGQVFAIDIQRDMLDKLSLKLSDSGISNVTPVLKVKVALELPVLCDFAIAIYVVHEIDDQNTFFKEMHKHLRPGAKFLIMEPDFIVSKKDFIKTLERAQKAGFKQVEPLNLLFSKAAVLTTGKYP